MSDASTTDGGTFRWACLLVAVAALAAFGWMLNDLRLQVQALVVKADRLADKADALVTKTDQSLPSILAQTERATSTLDARLPPLLARADTAAGNLSELSENLKQCRDLMAILHESRQNKDLLAYGSGILDLVGQQKASVGVLPPTPPSPAPRLERSVPAKAWAGHARKDVQFLSLIAKNKGEVLHGLARTMSASPWYIQLGEQAPRLLASWIKETHPESKDVN
jgi:hypothetical protein